MFAAPHHVDAIEMTDVTRRHRRRGRADVVALDGVSLRSPRGAGIALLGPNGAGKSTLLRMLNRLDRPDAGTIRVLGEDVRAGGRGHLAELGVVFQEPGLDGLLSVRENLELHAALSGLRRPAEACRRAAAEAGLEDRLADRVATLSGGLRRRVDLARALLTRPRVLLLDEPMAGLDPSARQTLLELLAARRDDDPDLTILLSTHLLDVAERADRVVLLAEGRVVADGAPDTLRRDLGATLVSAAIDDQDHLRRGGLDVRVVRGRAIAGGDPAAVEAAALALVRAGRAVQVGPPTLADVYAAHAGGSLEPERS